jgi:hypothetical protein
MSPNTCRGPLLSAGLSVANARRISTPRTKVVEVWARVAVYKQLLNGNNILDVRSALSPRCGQWRKAWGVKPQGRGARSLSLRSGRKPFQRNCSLGAIAASRARSLLASPPGAYAPGFMPASASRTQAGSLIRQRCDYPLNPLLLLVQDQQNNCVIYSRLSPL